MSGMIGSSGGGYVPSYDRKGYPAIPSVAAVAKSLQGLDSGAANLLMGFRATAGAGDDVVASERLSSGHPSTAMSPVDGALTFNLSTPASRVDVVGVMNGTATGNCIDQTDTAANAIAQMVTFTFPIGVSKIVVSLIGDKTGRYGELSVEGYSYA